MIDEIYIDELGFVWVGDFRLPFRIIDHEVEFIDKDRRRCAERGERFVRIEAEELVRVLHELK